ncbi:MAG TPA: FHA domain-containing protein, partial [Pseudoxanthomonas sp.]
ELTDEAGQEETGEASAPAPRRSALRWPWLLLAALFLAAALSALLLFGAG